MAKSQSKTQKIPQNQQEQEQEYSTDEFDYEISDDNSSDDDENDPNFECDIEFAKIKLSNLSIKSGLIDKRDDDVKSEIDDEDDSVMEEVSAPKLKVKDLKSLEDIQKIIDCGQVEKLKLEQCKMYLRKHGLRLTGKKDILVQRIKEHLEILNGGGEKKYPPSSFVLNCKGDACMGDIVMFEQTVYEGYNIASRSAIGPPCGKRIVAGRIVKESYGAAKQQHTFTVEVLWSKGDKPLPPLHPLLIKGRNLYKSNTLRQRWEDEYERQRVLNEKHSRGSLARSKREVRIQEKESRMNAKGIRNLPKERQNLHQEKNHKLPTDHIPIHGPKHANATDHISIHGHKHAIILNPIHKHLGSLGSLKTQKQNTEIHKNQMHQSKRLEQNIPVSVEFKENACPRLPISQPSHPQQNKLKEAAFISNQVPTSRAYKYPNSSLSCFAPPQLQPSRRAESTFQSHYGHSGQYDRELKEYPLHPANYPYSFQQKTSSASTCNFFNQQPRSYATENGRVCISFRDKPRNPNHESWSTNQLIGSNRPSLQSFDRRNKQQKEQQPCPYYPRGRCYYGDHCRFIHESN